MRNGAVVEIARFPMRGDILSKQHIGALKRRDGPQHLDLKTDVSKVLNDLLSTTHLPVDGP